MIKLKVGWEGELLKMHNQHHKTCKCGCTKLNKTVKSRIKELTKLISKGEAIVTG